MKGIPLSDKEYEASQAMLDSFRPERLHGKKVVKVKQVTNGKNATRRARRPKLAHLSEKVDKQTANIKKGGQNDKL